MRINIILKIVYQNIVTVGCDPDYSYFTENKRHEVNGFNIIRVCTLNVLKRSLIK